MFLAEQDQRVTELRGVGPVLAAHLARIGVTTVRDLLLHLPRRCSDMTPRTSVQSCGAPIRR